MASYLAMTNRFCHCEPEKQSHIGGGMASYLAIPNRFLSLRACEAVSCFGWDGSPFFQDATQTGRYAVVPRHDKQIFVTASLRSSLILEEGWPPFLSGRYAVVPRHDKPVFVTANPRLKSVL